MLPKVISLWSIATKRSNLHYDLRIQADGVLACWAVPKGFSYMLGDKRLAVRTEDHPFDYKDFEGAIPRGQYGAGTMKIWDAGRYILRKSTEISHALDKGELKLELLGRRLRGEWHLVQTKAGEGRNWLLFKAKDRYAGSGSDLFGGADMSKAVEKPMSPRAARMDAAQGFTPFSDPEWLFEPELVGRRVLAFIESDRVSLRTRSVDLAPSLPHIVIHLGRLRAQKALLDGIVVALDKNGTPSVESLDERMTSGGKGCVLYLFDVLYAEDWDLRRLPLSERRSVLRALLPESDTLLLVDAMVERGEVLARAAAESGFPAVIAKSSSSPYSAGASDDWRRILVSRTAPRKKARAVPKKGAEETPTVSNPRKVYWPEQGYTKQDLVSYYDRIGGMASPLPQGPAAAHVPLAGRDSREVLLPEAASGGVAGLDRDHQRGARGRGADILRGLQRPAGRCSRWSISGPSTFIRGCPAAGAWTHRTGRSWTWIRKKRHSRTSSRSRGSWESSSEASGSSPT